MVAPFFEYKEYKELYLFELQRKNDLTNSLAIPIGIVSIIAGALFYIISQISYPFSSIEMLEVILFVISTFLLSTSIYLLIKSYFNYAYGYIPTAQQIEQWRSQLVRYYEDQNTDDAETHADKDVTVFLTSKFAEHAHHNTLNNDSKSTYLHNANLFIISSIIVMFFTGGIFIIHSFSTPETTYKVLLVEPNKTGDSTMADDNKTKPKEPPRKPPTQEKPPPPPDRIIKEEQQPPEKK